MVQFFLAAFMAGASFYLGCRSPSTQWAAVFGCIAGVTATLAVVAMLLAEEDSV
jgi:hypothetical protein